MGYALEVDRCLNCGLTYQPRILKKCQSCGGPLKNEVIQVITREMVGLKV